MPAINPYWSAFRDNNLLSIVFIQILCINNTLFFNLSAYYWGIVDSTILSFTIAYMYCSTHCCHLLPHHCCLHHMLWILMEPYWSLKSAAQHEMGLLVIIAGAGSRGKGFGNQPNHWTQGNMQNAVSEPLLMNCISLKQRLNLNRSIASSLCTLR